MEHALQANAGAMAGGGGPCVHADAQGYGGHAAAHRRRTPAYIPHVGRKAKGPLVGAQWNNLARHALRLDAKVALELPGERQFPFGIGRHSNALQVNLHALGQWPVWEKIVETIVDQGLRSGLGSKSGSLGNLLDPGARSLDMRAIDVPHVEPDPGVVGHDVGSVAGLFVDIVNARRRLDMFTHQVNAVRAELSRVNRAASKPGSAASVGG